MNIINSMLSSDPRLEVDITFDDGYEGVFDYALEFLREIPLHSKVVFPITNYIGRHNEWDSTFILNRYKHLSNEQIRELHNNGWEIGSHTCSHRYLDALNLKQIKLELNESKDSLEQLTGNSVDSIAPPFGVLNQRVYDECVEAGYTKIFIQKKDYIKENHKTLIVVRNNVYSIDRNNNIINKIRGSRREKRKENRISSLNIITRNLN